MLKKRLSLYWKKFQNPSTPSRVNITKVRTRWIIRVLPEISQTPQDAHRTLLFSATPKPIPTIIVDAARRANGLERVDGFFGRNTTTAVPGDLSLLPTIDICTLEFPENYTHPFQISSLRVTACNLRKLHEDDQKVLERERIERLASLSGFLEPESTRHIRHQRQHLVDRSGEPQVQFDPRSRMVGSHVVITNAELQQNFNISNINR